MGTKNDSEKSEKVAPQLMEMKVGEIKKFDIEQQDTIIQAIQRKQKRNRRLGMKWSQRVEGLECIVTRIA